MKWSILFLSLIFYGCQQTKKIILPQTGSIRTGKEFYNEALRMNWKERDSLVVDEVLSGNIPAFLKKFVAIKTTITDSITRKAITATFFVSPDYLSIGTNDDWARICITPQAAQQIADSLHCFLPTRKIVDEIYKAATVKLEPVPMYSFRDSSTTMWQHHLLIEGQRRNKKGLITGIKKDIVISNILNRKDKENKVAIYGWHKPDGKPIQPLYAGHVNWYVDYSHGVRLVYRKVKINQKWLDFSEVLQNKILKNLLCDEADCSFLRYKYP